VRITATPFHVDDAPVTPAGAAPYRVGEHTHAVLSDVLGYSKDQIERLEVSGVIASP
jgi:crotonobetainyl-CoA:carnitine CoA-transferase CaiB-like acyl-CoA transferase